MPENLPEVLHSIPHHKGFYVYILRCKNGCLYTGWTTNVVKRFYMHAIGKGAKYTRANRPLELFYVERLSSKIEAMKREHEIKQYTRIQKIALKSIESRFMPQ